jgi:hypothetical protein
MWSHLSFPINSPGIVAKLPIPVKSFEGKGCFVWWMKWVLTFRFEPFGF